MPTCFFKRFLPFALTLIVGVLLGKFLGAGLHSVRQSSQQRIVSFAGGVGAGWNGSSSNGATYDRPFNPKEVDQKARLLYRLEPQYTEEARENAVEGTVVLRAIISRRGEVMNIRVVNGLPYGLTEKAVEAAREIRFAPAIKDGRAVQQYIQIEYNYSLF